MFHDVLWPALDVGTHGHPALHVGLAGHTLGETRVALFTSTYRPEIIALREIGCESANVLALESQTGVPAHRLLTCQPMPRPGHSSRVGCILRL